jgi:hypothetical protein
MNGGRDVLIDLHLGNFLSRPAGGGIRAARYAKPCARTKNNIGPVQSDKKSSYKKEPVVVNKQS